MEDHGFELESLSAAEIAQHIDQLAVERQTAMDRRFGQEAARERIYDHCACNNGPLLNEPSDERCAACGRIKLLSWQYEYLEAVNRSDLFIVCVIAGNQSGKSYILAYDLISESLGYQPHDGLERPKTQYGIALILPDFDNHARKFLFENVLLLLPRECVRVERVGSGSGAPRVIQPTDPITGHVGKPIVIYSHGQDTKHLEGTTLQRVASDEALPRGHLISLQRGLQKTKGKITSLQTAVSEPWFNQDIYKRTPQQGGDEARYYSITVPPGANRASRGGFIDDEGADRVESLYDDEDYQVRVGAKFFHLTGVVYPDFRRQIHTRPHHRILEMLEEHRPGPDGPVDLPHFLIVDPHPRQPWAMLWGFWYPLPEPQGTLVGYDEWPHEEFHKIRSRILTYDEYAAVIFDHQVPNYRIMDPNMGRSPAGSSGFTYAEEMARRSRPGFSLAFDTTIDDDLDTGEQAVHERLKTNESDLPGLLLSERCMNSIIGFENYTWDDYRGISAQNMEPKQKRKTKYKHFPDLWRYWCYYPATYACMKRRRSKNIDPFSLSLLNQPRARVSAYRGMPRAVVSAEPRRSDYHLIPELAPNAPPERRSGRRKYTGNL